MSKVFTGNAFLTTSKNIMDKFVKGRYVSSFKELTKEQQSNSIIVGPGKNTNLISFTYSFGSAAGSDQKLLTLRFSETGNLFEKHYLNANLEGLTLKDINKGIFTKKVYLTFGVGNSLKGWAGPFTLSLISTNYTIGESGRRDITLRFCPVTGPLIRNRFSDKDIQSRFNRINRTQRNVPPRLAQSDEINLEYSDKLNAEKIDDSLVKVVKSYLQKIVEGSDVLVVLPEVGNKLVAHYGPTDGLQNSNFQKFFGEIGLLARLDGPSPSPGPNNPLIVKRYNNILAGPNNIKLSVKMDVPPAADQNPTPDYFQPISKINSKIVNVLGQSRLQFRPYFICEDNIAILDLWKKYFGIKESSTSVFVYGDESLISTLLYLENVESKVSLPIQYPTDVTPNKESKKYENQGYRSDYATKIIKNKSSFHSDVADQLSLDTTEDDHTTIVDFRYNINDPNVLALNTESLPGYMSLFKETYAQKARLQAINLSKNLLSKAVYDALAALSKVISPSVSNLFRSIIKSTPSNIKVNQDLKIVNPLGPIVASTNKASSQAFQKALLNNLKRSFYKVTVRTIPFFHISSLTTLGRKCKITSNLMSIIGGTNYTESFLNGRYRIIGFNHVMTDRDMYSEFTLVKDYKESTGGGSEPAREEEPNQSGTNATPATVGAVVVESYYVLGPLETSPNDPIQQTIGQESNRLGGC